MTTTASFTWDPSVLDRKEKINRQTAAAVTAAVFSLLLLALFILGMYKQIPEPETQGFEVIFGTNANGSGDEATAENVVNENTVTDVAASVSALTSNVAAVTQNQVDAPVVNASPTVNNTPSTNTQPTVATGSQFSGFNNTANNASGLGTDNSPGITGDINSNGTNPTGGNAGDGSELLGRTALHKERPATQKDVYGTVRIKITVNSQGKVISAVYSSDGSTTADSYLKQISIEAALKWEWSADPQKRPEQIGWIDFVYKAQ